MKKSMVEGVVLKYSTSYNLSEHDLVIFTTNAVKDFLEKRNASPLPNWAEKVEGKKDLFFMRYHDYTTGDVFTIYFTSKIKGKDLVISFKDIKKY